MSLCSVGSSCIIKSSTNIIVTVIQTTEMKILKSSFKSRGYIQKREHEPCFEVSVVKVSSVTLTVPCDESQRKAYCNFFIVIVASRANAIKVVLQTLNLSLEILLVVSWSSNYDDTNNNITISEYETYLVQ